MNDKITEHALTLGIRQLLNMHRIWHFKHWGGPMGEKGVPNCAVVSRSLPVSLYQANRHPSSVSVHLCDPSREAAAARSAYLITNAQVTPCITIALRR